MPRNSGIGPKFTEVNMRLTKGFRFRSDSPARIEFTLEATNLFNHTNFAVVREIVGNDPNAPDYNTGTFWLEGRRDRDFRKGDPLSFTAAFDSRRLQFGLRFAF